MSENLASKLDWLQKRLGLNDEQLSKMVWKCPNLFQYSIPKKMEPTLLWLQEWLGLGNDGLSRVLTRVPTLFHCSVDTNLVPTFEFYERCIGTRETQELLRSYPTLLCYSLERRLKPRLEEVKNLGLEVDSAMLMRMGQYTEDQWRKSVACRRKKSGVLRGLVVLPPPEARDGRVISCGI